VICTNDDGIGSEGIAALAGMVADLGHDVVVIAPDRNMSGMSAALGPVEVGAADRHRTDVRRFDLAGRSGSGEVLGVEAWSLAAPPALGVFAACQGGFGAVPDLVVSGVNAGLNTGRSVLHSGTVGAALTAATFGIPAMAVSLQVEPPGPPDQPGPSAPPGPARRWETAAMVAGWGLRWLAEHAIGGSVLNLNVPNRAPDALRGLRWAPLDRYGAVQAVGRDPDQGLSFELRSADRPPVPDSDLAMVEAGFATATLVRALAVIDAEAAGLAPLGGPETIAVSPHRDD
jgi:5'-nucleotidase